MKKLQVLILAMCIGFSSFSQAINDQAVIPVSVTLNSIMRLNVTSGGNVEFLFSTIASYASGIANSARYNTNFSVASSVDFDVDMATETATFVGEATGATMVLAVVGYALDVTGSTNCTGTHVAVGPLLATETIISPTGVTHNGGAAHDFVINWECGTGGTITTIQSLNAAADRYSNNIFLTLSQN